MRRPRASDAARGAPPGSEPPPATPPPEKPVDGSDELGWRRERRSRQGFTLREYLDVAADGGALRRKSDEPSGEGSAPPERTPEAP